MAMFARAAANANLTPMERAVLRFLSVMVYGALLSAAQAALPLLNQPDLTVVPWGSVLHTFLSAFLLAMGLGVTKYASAQADPPLPGGSGGGATANEPSAGR